MATDKVIGIVVSVVLLSFLLLLGLNTLGDIKGGIGSLISTGESATAKLNPVDVKSNCEAWMAAGSDKFDPNNILYEYKIPTAFAPYKGFASCCGDDLEGAANDCLQPDSECRVVTGDIISSCQTACGSAITIYNYCQRQCNSEAMKIQCFDDMMAEERRPCKGVEDLRYRDCEAA